MAGYKPFPYKGFGGGLNLRDGPDVVQEDQAIDAMNVLFTTRGSVAQRSGYNKFTPLAGTNRYDSLSPFYKSDGTKQLVAGAGNRLEAMDANGVPITNITTPTASPHFFQRFGGPTAEHLYISNGADTVRRWTGSVFETPAYTGTTPNGKFLGLSATDNRLVNARFTGTTAGNNPSTVRFSVEGDPTSFTSTFYEDLTPGDGEEIMGVASWRDQIFVFKQSRFFVFYGNTLDDEGLPEFNYRPVDAGVGLAASQALAVSEQGIYFLDRTGVYFTTGNQPARVSELVEPIFHGGASVYFTGGALNDAAIDETTMVYHDERLWLSYPGDSSSVNNRNLIFDPHEKWWSLSDLPAGPMAEFRPDNVEELIFGYSSGDNLLGRHVDGDYTADDMGHTRHNVCTNPKAGDGSTTNWTNTSLTGFAGGTLGGGGFPAASAALTALGITTAFHATSDAANDRASISFPVVSGVTYTASFHIYLDILVGGGNALMFTINDAAGNVEAQQGLATDNTWFEIPLTFTANETTNWTLRLTQLAAGNLDFYWTAVLIEKDADALDTYFDGDGNAWTGTAEVSASWKFVSGVDGTAIAAHWQGGWFGYDTAAIKRVRESKVSGTGLVDISFSRDYRQTPAFTVERELSPPVGTYDSGLLYDTPGLRYGPSGLIQTKAIRKAIRGEVFSVKFANDTIHRSFKINRLTLHVADVRVPSVVKVS